ncbi:hypothetical protein GOP47_0021847 [Adiantum capillus-veneris]|uniref:Uncharacterized protein n=1 Tax=Adiantum capillus-veneris TaxID=13818 RepID=A0A9D4U8W6_ADICA|nr:hypothetical protein GOP47_0021847 [Adiantum capillus-veneris]
MCPSSLEGSSAPIFAHPMKVAPPGPAWTETEVSFSLFRLGGMFGRGDRHDEHGGSAQSVVSWDSAPLQNPGRAQVFRGGLRLMRECSIVGCLHSSLREKSIGSGSLADLLVKASLREKSIGSGSLADVYGTLCCISYVTFCTVEAPCKSQMLIIRLLEWSAISYRVLRFHRGSGQRCNSCAKAVLEASAHPSACRTEIPEPTNSEEELVSFAKKAVDVTCLVRLRAMRHFARVSDTALLLLPSEYGPIQLVFGGGQMLDLCVARA